ncbi:hypothetical protein GCM10027402_03010 [Arthrobacter monumenti]
MHVWFGAVAGVAALGDHFASLHGLPRAYFNGALTQMCEEHIGAAVAHSNHYVVTGDGSYALTYPTCLSQHVWHKSQL